MSNRLAIATVTAAVGQRVFRSAQEAVSGVALRLGRPTAAAAGGGADRRVHVYLYQVTPNAALRNADLPGRSSDGRLIQRPQAALDLHYLISFYGDDQTLEPDRMLGAVVRDLHARPLLSAQNIADAIASRPGDLDGSDLASAVDRVRLTPGTLTLEEQSKLWSVMVQTPHALSLIYTAGPVLIDSVELATPALPVLTRGPDDQGVDTSVGALPRLDQAWVGFSESAARQPRPTSLRAAMLGTRLVIDGANLGGDTLTLRLTHPQRPTLELTIAPADRTAQQFSLTLPDDAAAQTDWAAGLYGVVARVSSADKVQQSALWPLLLAPRITGITPNPAASVAGAVTLALTCHPQVQPGQEAVLVIADREVAAEQHASATDTLDFVLDPAPLGADQLVWLRVDGVDSMPVVIDPATGNFRFDAAQRVTIT
jgi:hypothetical protein